MSHRTIRALAMSSLLFASATFAGVPAGIDGTWYNPAQSGHGFAIEVVDAERAVALWYSYTPDGHPLTLYLDGRIVDDGIVAEAFAPSGMRFGSFDPAELDLPRWGEVNIAFSDCGHATVSYRGDDPAYGSGSLPIERLVDPASAGCDLAAPSLPPSGRYISSFALGSGFIDHGGRWYSAVSFAGDNVQHPGYSPGLVVGETLPGNRHGAATLRLRRLQNNWLCAALNRVCDPTTDYPAFELDMQFRQHTAVGIHRPDAREGLMTTQSLPSHAAVDARFLLQAHELSFAFPISQLDGSTVTGRIEVNAGELCVRIGQSDCVYRGNFRLSSDPAETDALEFDLQAPGNAPPYRGKAWILHSSVVHVQTHTLQLFGDNGDSGLVVAAQRSF